MKYDPLNDGISHVEYVEHLGSDLTVVNAARVSTNVQSQYVSDETGKWLVHEDERLIHYLAEHQFTSPFFHPQICLRFSMPIFLTRQWWRSTIGVCRSEIYRRYVLSEPEMYLPAVWRSRDHAPGGAEVGDFSERLAQCYARTTALYREALELGIAPEVAQLMLPLATYTKWIETGSLHYFCRVARLHRDAVGQPELNAYGEAVGKILSGLFPICWEALMASPAPRE